MWKYSNSFLNISKYRDNNGNKISKDVINLTKDIIVRLDNKFHPNDISHTDNNEIKLSWLTDNSQLNLTLDEDYININKIENNKNTMYRYKHNKDLVFINYKIISFLI